MASSLIIEEREGLKRRLELRGGGLPHHGAEFPIRQRTSTKWMPGNGTEATQQVLGPELPGPEWEGEWNTTKLASLPALYRERGGAEQRVARASSLKTIVEAITFAGALLRVTWTEDDFTEVREGRIAEFRPSYRSRDDIKWRIEWDWKGRGGSAPKVASLKKDGQLAAHKQVEAELNKVTAELAAQRIVQSAADLPGSASGFTLGRLEGFVDGIRDFTQGFADKITQLGARIGQLGDLIADVEALPADVAKQFVDAAASVTSECVAFSDAVSRKGPEAYSTFDQSASVRAIVDNARVLGGAKAASNAAMLAAAEARASLLRSATGAPGTAGGPGRPAQDVSEVLVARAGETFAELARRSRLADPTLGPAVARANGYPAFALSPRAGDVLVVPSAQAAQGLLPAA